MSVFGLKQFRHEGCQSYLLFDPASRKAALIDPQLALMTDYRAALAERRLSLAYALDTHIHADHLSATHMLRRELGCEIGMSDETRCERPTIRLRHGQKLAFGQVTIEVLMTPGHTPDSCAYFAGGKAVFTGDTLFIGGSGRTDFPGADPAAQWASIHDVLGKLPKETLVYPGHDYGDLLFSTIGNEAAQNPHWKIPNKEEFVAFKGSEKIVNPEGAVKRTVERNLARDPGGEDDGAGGPITACGTRQSEGDRVASISVEKLRAKIEKPERETLVVDVREPDEFASGHLPGALNLPLSELGFHLARFSAAKRVYFACHSGGRSILAARTLGYLGAQGAVNVTGGFLAWQNAGNPVEKP